MNNKSQGINNKMNIKTCMVYVRILGSNQEVVRLMWLIKYVSPALVMACSQPSGRAPSWPSVEVATALATGEAVKKLHLIS